MLKQLIVSTLLFAGSIGAMPNSVELLTKLSENSRLATDARANVSMTQEKSNQGIKTTDVMYYRRDKDNSFLIVMVGPESEKGNGYLRVGDNFWMYLRNTRVFQHINRDEKIGGTDASGGDFEHRPLTDLYVGVKNPDGSDKISEEKLGSIPVYKFDVQAKVSDVDYPKKTYWVRTDNSLLLKEEGYSASGALMQTSYYLKYTPVNNRFVAIKQIIVDEFEKGNKTIMEISNISTDKISDDVFTKAFLENLSK
jgi:outer membrane lipoprotein-sorting protein